MKIKSNNLSILVLSAAAVLVSACQPPPANSVINSNPSNTNIINSTINSNVNANVNSNPANLNAAHSTAVIIDTKEPDQYQATVALKLETSGNQTMTMPPLKAEVARKGQDRRMEFGLPNGEKLIYLDKDGKQFIISPSRKQYAELTKEALGFDVRRLLMPEQIVNQLRSVKGIERVGEEKVDGRDVVKYRYASTTNTQTKAGNVETESYFIVDKETGLPLRSETSAQSQTGNVQGINGLHLVTELNNIKTDNPAELFNEPTDYKKVEPEQIRQQVDTLFSAATAIIGQMLKNVQNSATPNR